MVKMHCAVLLASPASMVLAAAMAASAAVPPPVDAAWPGTLKLEVDATDLDHRIFRVHEEIPVRPGALTLLYPQWLPGNHSPRGPIDKLAGLAIRADGRPLAWKRDPVEVYAFHLDVPQGVARLDVDFDFLSPQDPAQGRVVMTPDMLDLQWNTVALYPAGCYTRGITIEAAVKLPEGWQFGSALDVAGGGAANATAADGSVRFVKSSIAMNIWWGLGTRASGEVISSDAY